MDEQFVRSLFEVVHSQDRSSLGKKIPTGVSNLYYFSNSKKYLEYEERLVKPQDGALTRLFLFLDQVSSNPADLEKIKSLEERIEDLESEDKRLDRILKIDRRSLSNRMQFLVESIIVQGLLLPRSSAERKTFIESLARDYDLIGPTRND